MASMFEVDWSKDPNAQSSAMSDTWESVKQGAKSQLIGGTAALARVGAEKFGADNVADFFKAVQDIADESAKGNVEAMSEAGRVAFEAGITSEEFWSNPLRATWLKSVNMLPSIAAAIIPGGLASSAARAVGAGAVGASRAATVGAAVGAGALASSESVNELYRRVDAASDETLRQQSPFYDTLRAEMSEREARKIYNAQLRGLSIPLNFLLGGLAGAIGPAGMVARRGAGGGAVLGAARESRLAAAGKGVLEGAATEAPQEAFSEYSTQSGLVKGGFQKEVDWGKVAASGLEGGYLGGILGGAGGAITHRGARTRSEEATIVTPQGPTPEQSAALDAYREVPVLQPQQPTPTVPPVETSTFDPGPPELRGVMGMSYDPTSTGYDERMLGEPTPQSMTPEQGQRAAQDGVPTPLPGDPVIASDERQNAPLPPEAVEPAAPPAGRVLEDLTPLTSEQKAEARKERMRQKKMIQRNIREQGLQLDEETGKVISLPPDGNEQVEEKNKARAAERAKRNETADKIMQIFEPAEKEQNSALRKRVLDAVETAKANGITKFGMIKRVRSGEGAPTAGWAWMVEANRLANKIKNNRVKTEDFNRFLEREAALRKGELDTVLETRRVEGDIAMAAKAKAVEGDQDVVDMAAQKATVVEKAKSPEDLMIEREEAGPDPDLVQEEISRVEDIQKKRMELRRRESEALRKEATTPASIAPATFQVQKTRRRVVPKKPDTTSYAPARRSPGEPVLRESDIGLEALVPKKTTKGNSDKAGIAAIPYMQELRGTDVIRAVRRITKEQAQEEPNIDRSNIHSIRFMQSGRIPALLRGTSVYIMSDVEYDAHYRAGTGGVYDHYSGKVFIPERSVSQGDRYSAFIMHHELVHAATARSLNVSRMAYQKDPMSAKGQLWKDGLELVTMLRRKFRGQYGEQIANDTYAFTDPFELVAEVNANPQFIQDLMSLQLESYDLRLAGVEHVYTKKTAWDAVLNYIRRALGLRPSATSALELVLKYSEQTIAAQEALKGQSTQQSIAPEDVAYVSVEAMERSVRQATNTAIERAGEIVATTRETPMSDRLLSLHTLHQIAQAADRFFQDNPVRKISDLLESLRTRSLELFRKDIDLHKQAHMMEYKYRGTADWDRFVDTGMDSTMFNLDPSKPLEEHTWLGSKNSLKGAQSRAKYPEIKARYDALPSDLRELLHSMDKFYRERQNKIVRGALEHLLKRSGHYDPALLDRMYKNELTDADEAKLGGTLVSSLSRIQEFKEIKGLYMPLMRRGNYVVRGTNKLNIGTGREIDSSTVEFDTEEEARKFAAAQDDRASPRGIYVDEITGKPERFDSYSGTTVRLNATDSNVVKKFRVAVQNNHVVFAESKAEANRIKAAMEANGLSDVAVQERRVESGPNETGLMGTQISRLVRDVDSAEFKHLSESQKTLYKQALIDVGASMHTASYISARRLPRRYVPGASRDFTRNLMEYSSSSSHYLARQEKDLALDKAVAEMDEQTDHLRDQNNDDAFARSRIRNEVRKRVWNARQYTPQSNLSEWVDRIKTVSFLARLAGPSWSVINSLQPSMVTAPIVAGRHGLRATAVEMHRSYQLISGLRLIGQGLKDTVRRAMMKDDPDGSTHFGEVLQRLDGQKDAGELRAMLRHLADVGSVDATNGFEIAELVKADNKVDRGLAFVDDVARQLPMAIETVNRMVSAITAYRLERKKGASVEAATQYAQDIVNNTQGHYSKSNAAPIFHKPVWSLSLQFKKYPQMMYHMLGQLIGRMIRNQKPGDRAEAAKQLGFLLSTHMLAAGAMGLPVEPLKFLLMGANLLGVTDDDWGDVEHYFRKRAVDLFGVQAAEVMMHGVTRAIPGGFAFDMSSRVGLDNMLLFGEPRSRDPKDVKSYIWDTVVGAPGSTVADFGKGVHHLMAGEYAQAAERLVPVKAMSDIIRSGRQAIEGKETKSGRQSMTPYSTQEAIVRGLGFTPAREAETSRMRSQIAGRQAKYRAERTRLMKEWITSESKSSPMRAIQKFNEGRPRNERITMTDLYKAARQRRREEQQGVYDTGLRATSRNARIVAEKSNYNTER